MAGWIQLNTFLPENRFEYSRKSSILGREAFDLSRYYSVNDYKEKYDIQSLIPPIRRYL